MSLSSVRKYLEQYGADQGIIELTESSATVQLAAAALHTEEDQIAKSLSFLIGDQPVIVVVSGKSKVDNHKFKERFHTKAKMIPGADVERLTSHPVGGVCPFDVNDGVTVYLDDSLKRFETVFPACGSSNSAIELTIPELEKYSSFDSWVDICKGWQEE